MVKLDEFLDDAEFSALESIGGGGSDIPKRHKARLLKLGYIQEIRGTVALTDAGQMRLALEQITKPVGQ